jgi:hypothetical protein
LRHGLKVYQEQAGLQVGFLFSHQSCGVVGCAKPDWQYFSHESQRIKFKVVMLAFVAMLRFRTLKKKSAPRRLGH